MSCLSNLCPPRVGKIISLFTSWNSVLNFSFGSVTHLDLTFMPIYLDLSFCRDQTFVVQKLDWSSNFCWRLYLFSVFWRITSAINNINEDVHFWIFSSVPPVYLSWSLWFWDRVGHLGVMVPSCSSAILDCFHFNITFRSSLIISIYRRNLLGF